MVCGIAYRKMVKPWSTKCSAIEAAQISGSCRVFLCNRKLGSEGGKTQTRVSWLDGQSCRCQRHLCLLGCLFAKFFDGLVIAFRKATGESMTIRIGEDTIGNTVIRLIGRIQTGDVQDLSNAMKQAGQRTVVDVSEVTIVDIDAVRFLRDREAEGIALLHCSRYIREWINRERKAD